MFSKNILAILIVFLLQCGFAFSQTTFQKVYGGIHDDRGTVVQQTSDGGFMIAGSTNSYTSGGMDYYLVKTDVSGDTLWTRSYGTSSNEWLSSAQQTADGGYILAGAKLTSNAWEIYVVKTSSNGTLQWSFSYNYFNQQYVSSIQQTADGGYIIGGEADTSNNYSTNYPYLLKISSNGSVSWAKSFFISGSDYSRVVSVKQIIGGGYVMAGTTNDYWNSDGNIFIIKTDASGNPIWEKNFLFSYPCYTSSIIETASGDFVVLGQSEANSSYYYLSQINVLQISSSGGLIWSRVLENANISIFGQGIVETPNGNFAIAGFARDTNYAFHNAMFCTTNSAGQFLWANYFGNTNRWTFFNSIDNATNGGFIMGGEIDEVTTPTDSGSLYMVKVNASGFSGCNETSLVLSTTSPIPTISNLTLSIGSGGTQQAITTLVRSGSIVTDGCTVGISNLENNSIKTIIFPNPFSEKTTIEISGNNTNEKREFELFDINGNVVREFYFTGNTIEVERKNLSSGIYFYRIVSENRPISSGKIIAE